MTYGLWRRVRLSLVGSSRSRQVERSCWALADELDGVQSEGGQSLVWSFVRFRFRFRVERAGAGWGGRRHEMTAQTSSTVHITLRHAESVTGVVLTEIIRNSLTYSGLGQPEPDEMGAEGLCGTPKSIQRQTQAE